MSHEEAHPNQDPDLQQEDLELSDDRAVDVTGGDNTTPSRPHVSEITVSKPVDVASTKLME